MEQNKCTECGITIPWHVQQCKAHRGAAKEKKKTQRSQVKVQQSQDTTEEKESGRVDKWADLHGGHECPAFTQLANLADAFNSQSHGLPDINVLTDIVNRCQDLKIGQAVGKYDEPLGIRFHIVRYSALTVSGPPSCTPLFNKHVKNKGSSGVCFENTFLPLDVEADGHLLIHQSLAPCLLCSQAYRAWARARNCTIVVAFDKGYDGSASFGVYIFSSTGRRFSL